MHQSFETTFACPSEDCVMCTGEACSRCGAGYMRVDAFCDHDVLERHANDGVRAGEESSS